MRIKEEILKEKRRQRNSRDMNVEWWQSGCEQAVGIYMELGRADAVISVKHLP